MRQLGVLSVLVVLATACNTASKEPAPTPAQPTATATSTVATPKPGNPASEGALRLGAPIEASAEKVALADVAKNPNAFIGKKFATTGTVSAVCQHMGCWMEIKDDSAAPGAAEAHIKMAGHAFFVPKTASGRKARVLATLVKSPEDGACAEESHDKMATAGGATAPTGAAGAKGAKKGCRAEAEAQLGRPLAKLELLADGVELM